MRYYELTESADEWAVAYNLDPKNSTVKDLIANANKVRKECQPYLKQVNAGSDDQILWRGFDPGEYSHVSFMRKDVRLTNRTPKDTTKETHDLINAEFTKRYGEPFRDGLFVTGSINMAGRYGYTFHVIPVGNFNFIWSSTVDDLWLATKELRYLTDMPEGIISDKDTLLKKELENFKGILRSYETVDLAGGIRSKTEIMMRPKAYYALNFDNITNQYEEALPERSSNKVWDLHHQALELLFYKVLNS